MVPGSEGAVGGMTSVDGKFEQVNVDDVNAAKY